MTTYVAFVGALEALVVTGVVKCHTSGRPNSLNTADLPGQWVELPRGEAVPATCANDYTRTLSADLVIALEPVAQNTRPTNFDACITLLDSIHTTLVAYNAVSITDGPLSWQSKLAYVQVNGIDYWAVVTSVTGIG
jgi:hypothetical protein